MNLKQMKYFLTIADEGSISRAARVLHISQPPLSQQLRQLEEELRVRLFVRGARSMTLTDAGRLLYQHAQNILELSDRAVKDLQQFEDDGRGSLRIGMVSSSEVPYVLERIRPFRDRYPRMEFQIYEGNTYQLLDWMKEDRVELAFVRTPFAEDGFECLFLEEETMAAVGKQEFFRGGQPEEITMQEVSRNAVNHLRRWETILNHSFREAGSFRAGLFLRPAMICEPVLPGRKVDSGQPLYRLLPVAEQETQGWRLPGWRMPGYGPV